MARNFTFWIRWLVVLGWILIAFGLALAFLNQTRVFDFAFNQRINPAFWQDGITPAQLVPFQRWIYGVLGATITGWGVFVVFLASRPLKNRERWAWICLLIGITIWFIVDTAVSAYFGVFFNVAFNLALAVSIYLPLAATHGEFR